MFWHYAVLLEACGLCSYLFRSFLPILVVWIFKPGSIADAVVSEFHVCVCINTCLSILLVVFVTVVTNNFWFQVPAVQPLLCVVVMFRNVSAIISNPILTLYHLVITVLKPCIGCDMEESWVVILFSEALTCSSQVPFVTFVSDLIIFIMMKVAVFIVRYNLYCNVISH